MNPSVRTFLHATIPLAAVIAVSGLCASPAFADKPPPSAQMRGVLYREGQGRGQRRRRSPRPG